MKKIFLSVLAFGLVVTTVGCGTSASESAINNLSRQLDDTANTIIKIEAVNPTNLSISRESLEKTTSKTAFDDIILTQNALVNEEAYKSEILTRTATLKNCLSKDIKLSKAQTTAVKDLTAILSKYTNSISYSRTELESTLKSINSLKRRPEKNAERIVSRVNRLACNSNARSAYYENIISTLEQIGCYFDCDNTNSQRPVVVDMPEDISDDNTEVNDTNQTNNSNQINNGSQYENQLDNQTRIDTDNKNQSNVQTPSTHEKNSPNQTDTINQTQNNSNLSKNEQNSAKNENEANNISNTNQINKNTQPAQILPNQNSQNVTTKIENSANLSKNCEIETQKSDDPERYIEIVDKTKESIATTQTPSKSFEEYKAEILKDRPYRDPHKPQPREYVAVDDGQKLHYELRDKNVVTDNSSQNTTQVDNKNIDQKIHTDKDTNADKSANTDKNVLPKNIDTYLPQESNDVEEVNKVDKDLNPMFRQDYPTVLPSFPTQPITNAPTNVSYPYGYTTYPAYPTTPVQMGLGYGRLNPYYQNGARGNIYNRFARFNANRNTDTYGPMMRNIDTFNEYNALGIGGLGANRLGFGGVGTGAINGYENLGYTNNFVGANGLGMNNYASGLANFGANNYANSLGINGYGANELGVGYGANLGGLVANGYTNGFGGFANGLGANQNGFILNSNKINRLSPITNYATFTSAPAERHPERVESEEDLPIEAH